MDVSAYLNIAMGFLILAGVVVIMMLGSAYSQLSVVARERAVALEREAAKSARNEQLLADRTLELKRCNSEFEHFAYIASHDLQEPLRMVASYTELLAQRYKDKFDERGEKYVAYASDGVKRMQRLIEALLSYSRVGTRGRMPEPTDLAVVARNAVQNLSSAMARSGTKLDIGTLPRVMADDIQIGLVFENLIDNSIKFRGDHAPYIRIKAEADGDQWVIRIADNGIGINTKFSERVFLLFQRLHDRETYEGIGMGLTISRKIVERHGGRIWYESQPGEGTTFFFTLPGVQQKAA